mgnify:CR=1 FL=1
MRPKFTTGMKEVLFAIAGEARKQWWWLVLALALALMLWLAPKVNATPLEDFISSHNLKFPKVALEEAKKQNLVAAAGIMNEKEQIFTVYFLPQPETFDIQEFDVREAKMEVRFYLVKKKITVEYETYRNYSEGAKLWTGTAQKKIIVFIELWDI